MVPGLPGAGLHDPDEEQGEPAEQDVGADAGFEAVEHRATRRSRRRFSTTAMTKALLSAANMATTTMMKMAAMRPIPF